MTGNLTAAAFAIVMAILMLLLRELILWPGKKNRDYDEAQADAPGASRLEIREDEVAYLEKDGRVIGSRVIGQPFSGPGYFHSRPSAR